MQRTNNLSIQEWAGCFYCKHIITGSACKAFPKGIPLLFVSGEYAHTEVEKELGQVGEFVYELDPNKKLPME